jgi:hypothetical protein
MEHQTMTAFARTAFPVVAGLFVACGVLQVFLAGIGVFDARTGFEAHRYFGYLFGWLTIILLVLALAGRLGRTLIGLSVLLIVLFALQSVFIALRADAPQIAALHPVNGFAILAAGVVATRISWRARATASGRDAVRADLAVTEAG